jgi:hypothetical protein
VRSSLVARVGVAMAVTAAPVLAAAQEPPAAEALFRDGRRLAEGGDYAKACARFAESERLEAAPGTLFNLADCEEHLGELASAWDHFRGVVEQLPPDDERVTYARVHSAALEPRLPRLTVVVADGSPAGTRVVRDGVELGVASLGVAVPLDPGPHSMVVVAPGRVDRPVGLTLKEGESQRVVAVPGAARVEPSRGDRTAGFLVGGVGAAALVVGAILGVRALSLRSESDADCPGGLCRNASGAAAYESAKTSARIADASMGLGLVALGVGAYLVLSSRVEVAPQVSRGGSSLGVRVRW